MEELLTVSDIEYKIMEKCEQYEQEGKHTEMKELIGLLGWILCGDEY